MVDTIQLPKKKEQGREQSKTARGRTQQKLKKRPQHQEPSVGGKGKTIGSAREVEILGRVQRNAREGGHEKGRKI